MNHFGKVQKRSKMFMREEWATRVKEKMLTTVIKRMMRE